MQFEPEDFVSFPAVYGAARGISLQKLSYAFGKNPFVCKKNPSKIRKNPFVLQKPRTLFRMSEMPLVVQIK